jgi:phospholipid/cholesterol/gamma-HCH transport system permease protein
MNLLARLGEPFLGWLRGLSYLNGVVWTVAAMMLQPRSWRRTNRTVIGRQVLFTAVDAVPFVSAVALLVGVSVVLQAHVWLTRFGQSGLIGPVLVVTLIRELGPLITNFVVIGRSGTAITAEVANMSVTGELKLLRALGIYPLRYVVFPRVLAVSVSVFCLTIVFLFAAFVSGFLAGALTSTNTGDPWLFTTRITSAIEPADVINCLAKTFLPGALTGAICAIEGARASGAHTEVPRATARSVPRCVLALFLTSGLITLLTYL